jgi:ubiquinone/menaquinone biosynthesis C-methylase UbiE
MELDIFSQKLYSNLSVKNKTVIDVGGGVGDSALLY